MPVLNKEALRMPLFRQPVKMPHKAYTVFARKNYVTQISKDQTKQNGSPYLGIGHLMFIIGRRNHFSIGIRELT